MLTVNTIENGAFQANCYLLINENREALVIDPGAEPDKICDTIRSLDLTVTGYPLTHGHMDHCAATLELSQELAVPVEGPHREDDFWIQMLPQSCEMSGMPVAQPFVPDRWLEQGDTVTVGEQTITGFSRSALAESLKSAGYLSGSAETSE